MKCNQPDLFRTEPAAYEIFINSKSVAYCDTPEQAWDIIESYPFGSRYEVDSPQGLDTAEFVPY